MMKPYLGPDHVQQLVERALHCSFNDTDSGDAIGIDTRKTSVEIAIKRVNMITENPVKLYDLVKMYVDKIEQRK